MPHIVWDWNGTLLDDLPIVLDSVNASLAQLGWSPISVADYRTHYTRPVKKFYTRLAGRPVTDEEWHAIDGFFHEEYRQALSRVRLAADAAQVLGAHNRAGKTQSLLSMFPHEELIPLVEQFEIDHHFVRIDGLRGTTGTQKAEPLRRHLAAIGRPERLVMIGDTPDDLAAAEANEVPCVLYDGGGHHRPELEALGVPVASTLSEALHHAASVVRSA